MLSRDTAVHLVALVVGFALLLGVELLELVPETETATIAVLILFYGIVLGGAHFYLALRNDDGMVPVEARWRYLTMLAVLLVTGAAIFVAGETTVFSVELSTVGLVVIVVTVVVYVYSESKAGFQRSLAGE